MNKLRFLSLSLVISIVMLTGCEKQYDTKASYFGGTVEAEYKLAKEGEKNEYFTLVFNEPGFYKIVFPYNDPRFSKWTSWEGFNFTIERNPPGLVIHMSDAPTHWRIFEAEPSRVTFHINGESRLPPNLKVLIRHHRVTTTGRAANQGKWDINPIEPSTPSEQEEHIFH